MNNPIPPKRTRFTSQQPQISPSIRVCLMALIPALLTAEMAQADLIVNGVSNATYNQNSTMVYTSDPTDPTSPAPFGIFLATGPATSASLSVQSGTLNLTSNNTVIIGQVNAGGVAAINVSGGTLNLSAPNNSQIFGNGGGVASVNVSGGVFNLTLAAAQTFFVGREGGTGQVNITGGLFSTDAANFTLNTGGGGANVITLGAGSGEFRFTNTPAFTFGNLATSYFNFSTGSGGKLSIFGYTESQFDAFVANGTIKINGVTADESAFSYTNNGGLGTYQLVPEPGTWAMLAIGAAGLFGIKRRRKA